jgi:integrase
VVILFNNKAKDEFLKNIEKESLERNQGRFTDEKKVMQAVSNTVNAYGNVFKSSEVIEAKYDTDLCNFNINQITELFQYRNPKTKTSARTVGRIVTKYIDWAITNNLSVYKKLEDNPLRVSQNFFNDFVPKESTQYLSVDEIKDTIDYLINDQDAVIVALLFNGVQGKQLSEIRNLTKNDINGNEKKLNVLDDKTGKYRPVYFNNDELNTFKMLKRAYLDTEYIKKNGEMEYNPRVKDVVEMPSPSETPYIIKTAKTQGLHYGERATQYTIINRIDMMRTLKGLEDYSTKLNTKNIVRSGMIFEAKRLLDTEGGELDSNKLKKVCDKFNVKNHWAVRDFINMEVINALYGDDLNKSIEMI